MTLLSKNFTLEEMIYSPTAIRLGINNNPSQQVVDNLTALCENVLEPLRALIDEPIKITSGYRSIELNKAIGGAVNSQHTLGQAADIHVNGLSIEGLYSFIKKVELPIDQLIQEFNSWVHVSFSDQKRGQHLRATKINGQTVYSPDNI